MAKAAPSAAEMGAIAARAQEQVTGPGGPMPLRDEDVRHFGTTQRYRCWQRGPLSAAALTFPELFNRGLDKLDQTFIVFNDERYTYGDILSQAAALSRELRLAYGLAKGDRVGIAARNYPEWVIAFIAAASAGACVLPMNSWWKGDEMRYGLEDSGTKVLFADAERLDGSLPAIQQLGVKAVAIRCERPGCATFASLVASGSRRAALPPVVVDQDEHALLMYTSGTTSKPKGVLSTHRNVMSALNVIPYLQYYNRALQAHVQAHTKGTQPGPPKLSAPKRQDSQLCSVPLFHATGCHSIFLTSFFTGRKLVLMSKWDAGKALQLIDREKVTSFTGVPTMSYELMNHPDFKKYDTSTLASVGGGGAAFRPTHAKDVKKKFKNARGGQGFGMTETNAITVLNGGADYLRKPTSCGRCVINTDVAIFSDSMDKLPAEQVGEIALAGPGIMTEYWKKPEKTQEAFHVDKEGKLWMRTGDVGRVDSEGFIYIMDRIKDLIIRGGENISCAEVEAAVYEHADVKEAAAFGLPDERLGETVAVAIVWKPGATAPANEVLKKFIAERVAKFKVPSDIFAWPGAELPRGATGKIQKRDIRDRIAAARKAGASKL